MMQGTQRRMLGATVGLVSLACLWPAGAYADPPANKIFGYEAGVNSRILEYDIDKRTSTVTFKRSCVPNPGFANGRGIALGARQGPDEPSPGGASRETRILYNTFVPGDGLIHRNRLPAQGCQSLAPVPFGEGAGPPNQDDIGALDFHDTDDGGRGKGQDPDILYAAGYLAIGGFQILYKVDGENGNILGRCQALTRNPPDGGNDTLTFARLKLGSPPQAREVLLTDFGEFRQINAPNSLAAVDEESLTGPPAPAPAPPCRIVADFPNPVANGGQGVVTGADYEKIPKPGGGVADSLVANGVFEGALGDPASARFYDANNPPFSVGRDMGPTAPSTTVEDNTVERINPPLGP
jgi:hypothetical protein